MRTIPACNAVRRGLLHIIDFRRSAPSLFGRHSLCLHLDVSRDSEKIL